GEPPALRGPVPQYGYAPAKAEAGGAAFGSTQEGREGMTTTTLLARADRLVAQGKLIDAEITYAKAIQMPDQAAALNAYGDFLRKGGRLVQAQSMYEKVLELDSTHLDESKADAYRNLSDLAWTRGELENARQLA